LSDQVATNTDENTAYKILALGSILQILLILSITLGFHRQSRYFVTMTLLFRGTTQ